MRAEEPGRVTQPWYSEYAEAIATTVVCVAVLGVIFWQLASSA